MSGPTCFLLEVLLEDGWTVTQASRFPVTLMTGRKESHSQRYCEWWPEQVMQPLRRGSWEGERVLFSTPQNFKFILFKWKMLAAELGLVSTGP